MAVGGEFVLLLHGVAGQLVDFALTFAAQVVAHHRKEGAQHHIHQIVTAHIEVGLVGRHAQLLQLVAQGLVGGACLRKTALQRGDLAVHAAAEGFDHAFGVVKLHLSQFDSARKVGERKLGVGAVAIGPHVPHQEGVDGAGEGLEKGAEVEEFAIVERGHDTHAVQHLGMALQIFDGVDPGVQNVGRAAHHGAGGGGALHQNVVVGVDTGDHVGAESVGQGDLLAPAQGDARGEDHFELHVRGRSGEHVAPEEDVVVALDVGHGARSCTPAFEAGGSGDVGRIELGGEARHGSS